MSRRFDPSLAFYLVGFAALAYAVWVFAGMPELDLSVFGEMSAAHAEPAPVTPAD